MRTWRIAGLSGLICALACAPALAIVVHGPVWSATYVAAYQSTFGAQGEPFTGTLKLSFNHGIISGTYVSNSVRPDPLRGRPIAVSGGVSEGHVTLNFSASGGFTVRGTLAEDGEISGTATIRGRFFSFLAKVKSSP
jgi:hypothetical protein